MKISRELLANVLELNIQNVYETNLENVAYDYFLGDNTAVGSTEFINIYQLIHKCEEWALIKGYKLSYVNNICFLNLDLAHNEWESGESFKISGKLDFTPFQWIYNKELLNDK